MIPGHRSIKGTERVDQLTKYDSSTLLRGPELYLALSQKQISQLPIHQAWERTKLKWSCNVVATEDMSPSPSGSEAAWLSLRNRQEEAPASSNCRVHPSPKTAWQQNNQYITSLTYVIEVKMGLHSKSSRDTNI